MGDGDAFLKYLDDARAAVRIFASVGTHVYLAGAPVSRPVPGSFQRGRALNVMYSWLAFLSPPGTVTYIDAGTAVQLGSDYVDELPCLPEEPCTDPGGTSVVRSCDGVHLCPGDDSHRDRATARCLVWSSGAYRYGRAMAAPVIAQADASRVPTTRTASESVTAQPGSMARSRAMVCQQLYDEPRPMPRAGVHVRRAAVHVVEQHPVPGELRDGPEASELPGDRGALGVAAFDHVGMPVEDVGRTEHAHGDDVLARHVRRVARPLVDELVGELALEVTPLLLVEQADRRGELLDADDVLALGRTARVPQACRTRSTRTSASPSRRGRSRPCSAWRSSRDPSGPSTSEAAGRCPGSSAAAEYAGGSCTATFTHQSWPRS